MYFTSISLKLNSCVQSIFVSAALLTSNFAVAQFVQNERFETSISNDENSSFTIASADKAGLIIHKRQSRPKIDNLEIIQLDTSLQEVWRGHIDVAKDLDVMQSLVKDGIMFILFKSNNAKYAHFHIATSKLESAEFLVYPVKNIIPFRPTDFVVTEEAALIAGYYNYRPLVLHYSFALQQSKILPGFFNEPGELTQIKSYPDNTIEVIVSTDNYEKRKCLWIRKYDSAGDLIQTTILQPDEKKHLIFGRSIAIDDEQVVVGVYGRFKEYSRGIFAARIQPAGEYQIQYYDYGELEHFFNYLKANRVKRIKGRIERKKIKGKKARFNYRLIVHEVINTGNGYVMLGEAFYPRYAYSYGFNQTAILIGYQYTHAVVIGFDKKGNLTWDNSFEINDVMTRNLEQFVKIQPHKDQIILQYVFQNKIRTKIINNSEIIEGSTFSDIKLKYKDDIIKGSDYETAKLDYWYDGRLYVYGVQQIKNFREISVDATRRVFFINKISYK